MRFSFVWLLVGVLLIGLSLAAARSLWADVSPWSVALGGLSLGTVGFALLAAAAGRSAPATLLSSVGIYGWGVACLTLADLFALASELRVLLVVFGIAYTIWVCLPPMDWGPEADRLI